MVFKQKKYDENIMIQAIKDKFFPETTITFEGELIELIKSGNTRDLANLIEIKSINPSLLTKVRYN
jgi:hypothetical protein